MKWTPRAFLELTTKAGRGAGVTSLHAKAVFPDGRAVRVEGNHLRSFASGSYLGLEVDTCLKQSTSTRFEDTALSSPLPGHSFLHPFIKNSRNTSILQSI